MFGFRRRRLDGRGDIPDGNEFVPKAVNADRGDEVASPAQVAPPDEHPSLGPNLRRSPARYAELEQFFEAGLWKAWLAGVTPSAGLIAAYALVGSRLDASIELCRKLGATPCGASSPQCSISRDHRLLAIIKIHPAASTIGNHGKLLFKSLGGRGNDGGRGSLRLRCSGRGEARNERG